MAAPKKQEPKSVLEREFNVPLRKGWLKVPRYKRANKAVKTLKEFLARHMKLYDDDLRKIKLDILLNNELRFRGMKKPPAKVKVKAVKYDDGIVRVELVNVPAHVKFAKLKKEKKKEEVEKKVAEKAETKPAEEEAENPEESEETKEKEAASKEETQKIAKSQAKTEKHTSKDKRVVEHRKALAR